MRIFPSPLDAIYWTTRKLLEDRKLFSYVINYAARLDTNHIAEKAYDESYSEKSDKKVFLINRKKVSPIDWMINVVFPIKLYDENGRDLNRLLEDNRFYDPIKITNRNYYSAVGRMCQLNRPRLARTTYRHYLDYVLDRWKYPAHRAMPHYYFDTESPDWIFEELFNNPNQIKTGRTSVACTTNFSFRWDSKKNRTIVAQILKHSMWTHLVGDFLGMSYFVEAFCKELKVRYKFRCEAVVSIIAMSVTLDDLNLAKQFVKYCDLYRRDEQ